MSSVTRSLQRHCGSTALALGTIERLQRPHNYQSHLQHLRLTVYLKHEVWLGFVIMLSWRLLWVDSFGSGYLPLHSILVQIYVPLTTAFPPEISNHTYI